jgi:hypothetical protein
MVLIALLGLLAAQDPPPPPDFLDRKSPVPKEILDKKTEGWYLTGIPLMGVDPEVGAVLGAQAQIFDNGPRSSPFFAYAPYRRQLQIGAASTKATSRSRSSPTTSPSIYQPWRIKSYVGYTQNKFQLLRPRET